MAVQGVLEGFDEVDERLKPLFFAFQPSAGVSGQLERLQARLRSERRLQAKWLKPKVFHITLQPVDIAAGAWDKVVANALHLGSALAWRPLAVQLDRAQSFRGQPGRHPFVLSSADGAPAITALQEQLYRELKRAGLGGIAKPEYTPHLTLAYAAEVAVEQDIEPVRWTADELVLVKSLYGQGEHVVLGRWKASGEAAE